MTRPVNPYLDHSGTGPLTGFDRSWVSKEAWVLAAIVAIGLGVRSYALGRLSFWYDEVVTMRLARAGGPGALLERMFQIDATRAPLHPLLLSLWIALFGPSEAAARGFSVACGVATIVLIYQIARTAFDSATGLWASWLAVLSPLLVVYDREARMYAWLVMLTCLSWRLMLSLRGRWTFAKAVLYVIGLTALAYSHPLGVLMLLALTLAALLELIRHSGTWPRWLAVYGTTAVLVLPWLPNYLDHPPEYLSGRLPLKFLLGTPIGFIGGGSPVLVALTGIIAFGIARRGLVIDADRRRHIDPDRMMSPALLLVWLIVPPVLLYVYSWLADPIFGPARYTVFVAPAFLILVAAGLRQIPALALYPLGLVLTFIAVATLRPAAYDRDLKADWRAFAHDLTREMLAGPDGSIVVLVSSADPRRNVEVETARYYLPAGTVAIAAGETATEAPGPPHADAVYYTAGLRSEPPAAVSVPKSFRAYRFREDRRYPGLIVYRGFP
jgi:uncharacterized membrane protein